MSAAERLVRGVAATLPAAIRERHREEWLADLDGASEAGIARSDVAWGAAAFALTLSRSDPAVSGMTRPALAARRAHWGLVVLGLGTIPALGLFVAGAFDTRGDTSPVVVLATAAVATLVAVGLLTLMVAAATALPLPPMLAFAVAAVAMVVAVGVGLAAFAAFALLVLGFPILLVGTLILVFALVPARGTAVTAVARWGVGAGTVLAVALIVALGVLHVLVWSPIAKLPGLTLDEIYAGLAAANETPSPVILIAWGASAVLAALAVVAFAVVPAPALRRGRSRRRLVLLALVTISVTSFSVWVAGFGMGMGIADTFVTDGGDAGVAGRLLMLLGVLVGMGAMLLAAPTAPRQAGANAALTT